MAKQAKKQVFTSKQIQVLNSITYGSPGFAAKLWDYGVATELGEKLTVFDSIQFLRKFYFYSESLYKERSSLPLQILWKGIVAAINTLKNHVDSLGNFYEPRFYIKKPKPFHLKIHDVYLTYSYKYEAIFYTFKNYNGTSVSNSFKKDQVSYKKAFDNLVTALLHAESTDLDIQFVPMVQNIMISNGHVLNYNIMNQYWVLWLKQAIVPLQLAIDADGGKYFDYETRSLYEECVKNYLEQLINLKQLPADLLNPHNAMISLLTEKEQPFSDVMYELAKKGLKRRFLNFYLKSVHGSQRCVIPTKKSTKVNGDALPKPPGAMERSSHDYVGNAKETKGLMRHLTGFFTNEINYGNDKLPLLEKNTLQISRKYKLS